MTSVRGQCSRRGVPLLASRTVNVHFNTVCRRDLQRARERDEAQVVFLFFSRVVVQVQECVTNLPRVGAVPVLSGLEVEDRHIDGLPVPSHIEA